jgi:hypothetical protein
MSQSQAKTELFTKDCLCVYVYGINIGHTIGHEEDPVGRREVFLDKYITRLSTSSQTLK